MKTIIERVFVETPVDTDGDGKRDLIAVYIYRPQNLKREKIPAVFVANPYFRTCNEDWYVCHDVDHDLMAFGDYESFDAKDYGTTLLQKAESLLQAASVNLSHRQTAGYTSEAPYNDNYLREALSPFHDHLLHTGYAVVYSAGLGTLDSQGYTIAGSAEETLAFKAVIDWLNGRESAFADKESNIKIGASWCTGNVAMMGKSYLGTIQMAVASTGVEGLKTIIPEAGISSWYNYYRENGLTTNALEWQGDNIELQSKYCFSRSFGDDFETVREGYFQKCDEMLRLSDRDSGNYNGFWDERNYRESLKNYKGSIFLIQGLKDWNVKPDQAVEAFKTAEINGNERRMILHRGEHVYVYDQPGADVTGQLDRWLAHYLKGEVNGAEKEPKVRIEDNLNSLNWYKSESFPPEGTGVNEFFPKISNNQISFKDDISLTVYDTKKDNQAEWIKELVLDSCCLPDDADSDKLKVNSTGTAIYWDMKAERDLRMSGRANVSFDCAIDRRTAILSVILADISDDFAGGFEIVTSGHMNAENRYSIMRKAKIIPNEVYNYQIPMIPMDYTFKSGHRLRLIIFGSDCCQTLRQTSRTEYLISGEDIRIEIPCTPLK